MLNQVSRGKQLRADFASLVSRLSDEDKTRWSNGQCHSFALALAAHASDFMGLAPSDLEIQIATRNGINPDSRRRKNFFSHAVLCIHLSADDWFSVDAEFDGELDPIMVWENKWFQDGVNKEMVDRFWLSGQINWLYPDETDSVFDWQPVGINSKEVSRTVRKIDGSFGPSEKEIAYAMKRLAEAQIQ